MDDPLYYLPIERWSALQEVFKADWPRCIAGYYVLETQKQWRQQGFDYDFHVYCPYGDVSNGMVALNKLCHEVIVISPHDSPVLLEKALLATKVLDWHRPMVIPFAPQNIIDVCKKLTTVLQKKHSFTETSRFILGSDQPKFEVRIPPELSFNLLTLDQADLINSVWPHRYPGSVSLFKTLINHKAGWGLYKNRELVSWIFTSEHGHLLHLFTLEEHRKRGYADLLLKLFSNMLRKSQEVVFGYVVKGNDKSMRLFEKLGFSIAGECAWCNIDE